MEAVRAKENETRHRVEAALKELLREIADIDPSTISDSSSLEDDIQLQSIAFVELQTALEEAFDIELDPVEVIERNNFGAIVALIAEKVMARLC